MTVVILSAIVPTLIAQQFQPATGEQDQEDALGAEDISPTHRRGSIALRRAP